MPTDEKDPKNEPADEGEPKPRHPLPEMPVSRRRRRKRSRRKKFYRIRSAFTRSLFTIAVFAIGGGLIWYFLFYESGGNNADADVERKVLTSFEKVMESDDPGALLSYSTRLDDEFMSLSLPVKVSRLQEKLQIGRRLETLHADEPSYLAGLGIQLDSLLHLDTLNIAHSLSDLQTRKDLNETATRLAEHPDADVSKKASLGLSLSALHDYLKDSSDENYELMESRLVQTAEKTVEDFDSAKSLKRLIDLVEASKNEDHNRRLKLIFGNQFKESEDVGVWSVGAELHDDMALGEIDYAELLRLVTADDPSGLEQLDRLVNAAAESGLVSAVPISKLIAIVEALASNEKFELESEYIRLLKTTENANQHPRTLEIISNALKDYETRKSLKGKKFELKIANPSVSLDKVDGKLVVLAFYSTYNIDSQSCLERLKDLTYFEQSGVVFVLCNGDPVPSEETLAAIAQGFTSSIQLTREIAPEYFEQCPIARFPFILLLDAEHRVTDVNVNIDSLRSRIERLLRQ